MEDSWPTCTGHSERETCLFRWCLYGREPRNQGVGGIYLESLHNKERFGATRRFRSAHLKIFEMWRQVKPPFR